MKIAILSGAYGNSGDKLIESRCIKLVQNILSDTDIKVFSRKTIKQNFAEINDSDLALFSGGPIYQKNISANFSIQDVCHLECPIKIIGGGWKGYGRCLSTPYYYQFYEETKKFLQKVDENSGLACRDLYSVKALKNAGFSSAIMTGCPAWYDLENVHCIKLKDNDWDLKKIYISDPADTQNYYLVFQLIEKIHQLFSSANITFVLHRATESEYEIRLENQLKQYDYLKVVRLNGDAEAFDIYRDCDLHIGFRVHAHIFNLSLRKKSILIEEDGRGAGVNEALGIPGLLAYNDENQKIGNYGSGVTGKLKRKIKLSLTDSKNIFLSKQVEDYIEMMIRTDGIYYNNAFALMEEYFKSMSNYIFTMGK